MSKPNKVWCNFCKKMENYWINRNYNLLRLEYNDCNTWYDMKNEKDFTPTPEKRLYNKVVEELNKYIMDDDCYVCEPIGWRLCEDPCSICEQNGHSFSYWYFLTFFDN